MRNAALASYGNTAPNRQGVMNLVPKPMKGGITLPNFTSAMRMLLQRQGENPEGYDSLKAAGGNRVARMDFGGVGWSGHR